MIVFVHYSLIYFNFYLNIFVFIIIVDMEMRSQNYDIDKSDIISIRIKLN